MTARGTLIKESPGRAVTRAPEPCSRPPLAAAAGRRRDAGSRRRSGAGATAPPAAAGARVPRGRRPRVAERHGHRRHRQLRHRPRPPTTSASSRTASSRTSRSSTARNLPIALALLLDTSASMDTKLPTAQEAAIGFARRLRPQDLAEVIDFDSRVVVLQNFTNSAAELEQAISKTSAGGSTSLYNAVYIALKDLKKVVATNTEEIRRQAIVVLSDGEDTSSLLPFEEVLDLAKRSETAIYCDRPARRRRHRHDDQGLQGGGVRAAAVRAGDRRRARSSRTSSRTWRASTARSPTSCRASTRSATRREPEARRRLAPRRRAGRTGRASTARTKQGYFAPTASLTSMNFVPLVLYAAALRRLRVALRAARSRPSAASATTLLVRGGAGAHLRHRHADDGGRARAGGGRHVARSRPSCGCWRSSYLYTR